MSTRQRQQEKKIKLLQTWRRAHSYLNGRNHICVEWNEKSFPLCVCVCVCVSKTCQTTHTSFNSFRGLTGFIRITMKLSAEFLKLNLFEDEQKPTTKCVLLPLPSFLRSNTKTDFSLLSGLHAALFLSEIQTLTLIRTAKKVRCWNNLEVWKQVWRQSRQSIYQHLLHTQHVRPIYRNQQKYKIILLQF